MYRLRYWLALVVVLFVASGCVKSLISIEVARDGSGTVGMALGMDEEARAFVGEEGIDPIESLNEELSAEPQEEVAVRRWTEGDYEWVEVKRNFDNLDELHEITAGAEMFERFALIRDAGLLKDTFTLEAEFTSPLEDEVDTESLFDPGAFFEMDFSATLPGKVTYTNGSWSEDTSAITWDLRSSGPTVISARSEVWNLTARLGLVVASIVLTGLAAASIGSSVMYLRTRRENTEGGEHATV